MYITLLQMTFDTLLIPISQPTKHTDIENLYKRYKKHQAKYDTFYNNDSGLFANKVIFDIYEALLKMTSVPEKYSIKYYVYINEMVCNKNHKILPIYKHNEMSYEILIDNNVMGNVTNFGDTMKLIDKALELDDD